MSHEPSTRPPDCRQAQPECSRPCRYALPSGACSLWLAQHHGPHTLQQIGLHFGVTREWIRQIESAALAKLRGRLLLLSLTDLHPIEHEPVGRQPQASGPDLSFPSLGVDRGRSKPSSVGGT